MSTIVYIASAILILLLLLKSHLKIVELHEKLESLAKEKESWKQQAHTHQQMYISIEQRIENIKDLHKAEISAYVAEFRNTLEQRIKEVREDANKRSRATMRGQATEHLAPLMQTEWDFKDFRFIGDPIDYLVVVGSSAIKDGTSNEIESVVLLDIKTGKSQLNKTQRRIRDAVVAGNIFFAVYNPDTEKIRQWPEGKNDAE